MIFWNIPAAAESAGVKPGSGLRKSVYANAISHDDDALRRHQSLGANRARESFGHGNDAGSLRQHQAVKSIEREEHVASDDQFCPRISAGSIGCKWVVSGHVRMNNLDRLLTHEAGKLTRAGRVKSITQRQRRNVFPEFGKLAPQRRVRPQGRIKIVSTSREALRE